MANQQGIAIVIRAFLPTGKTLDEQFAALSIVKQAHETGDYGPLLIAAKVEEVKTEQKTRRVEEAQQGQQQAQGGDASGQQTQDNGGQSSGQPAPGSDAAAAAMLRQQQSEAAGKAGNDPGKAGDDGDVPDFLKKAKASRKAAA